MKCRLLSLLLAVALIAVSVSAIFPTLTMADTGAQAPVVDGDIDVDMSEKDPIALVKAKSSNYDYGFVTPIAGQYVYAEGDDVSFTAVPLASHKFVGWYKEGETTPVTTDLVLTYTYNSNDEAPYYAIFEEGSLFIKNASGEGYNVNISLSCAQYEDTPEGRKYLEPSSVDGWHLDAFENNGNVTWESVGITNEMAHTGNQSFKFNSQWSYAGVDITGLKKNTNYMVSFYVYLKSGSTTDQNLNQAFVVPKGTDVAWGAGQNPASANRGSVKLIDTLGYYPNPITTKNKWVRVAISFNTKDNADVALWLRFAGNSGSYYADNFGIIEGDSYQFAYASGMGGSVTCSNDAGLYSAGQELYLTATPDEGNTFAGWYTSAGEFLSNQQTNYKCVIDQKIEVVARFDGYNMPTREYFASKGEDGTFENGTITGWYGDSDEYDDSSWCGWDISDKYVSEGEKALKLISRFRTSVLPLTGLTPNTDYKFCFDYIHPNVYHQATSNVQHYGIISAETFVPSNANIEYAVEERVVPAGLGWQRVELYFNTGNATAVNFIYKYYAQEVSESVHMDNIFLYEYSASENLTNGDFSTGKEGWMGDTIIAEDAGNSVLEIAKGKSAVQLYKMDQQSQYTVKFRAKGKVAVSVGKVNATTASAKTALTSQSYVETDSADWENYEFQVYSNIHPAATLAITGLDGTSYVDDIVITKDASTASAVIEKFDFENGRFDIPTSVNANAYQIYTATSEGDANVHSGLGSLKFKYTEANSVVENLFDAAYLTVPVRKGNSYKVTFRYKIAGGRLGGSYYMEPDMEGLYIGENDSEHDADDEGWNRVNFYFTVSTNIKLIKARLANIIYNTASDVYIDDLTIVISPPILVEKGSRVAYCEDHYNRIENGNFEEALSNGSWPNLPSTMKVVKNKAKALKGSHYLTVSAGTKYVLPVQCIGASMNYFGISVRADAKAKGKITLADSIDPLSLYMNTDEIPDSYFDITNTGNKWERSSFKFSVSATGLTYLIIECTEGSFDIDSVMLFKEDFGYRYDPNDYTIYVPYDYEATKSPTVVINGGFGEQPYYVEGDGPSSTTPNTGDTAALPMVILFVAILSSTVLVLVLRKRRAGANVDA